MKSQKVLPGEDMTMEADGGQWDDARAEVQE